MMRIVPNFLHQRTLMRLRQYHRETRTMRCSLTGWQQHVIGNVAPVMQFDLEGDFADSIKAEIIDAHHLEPYHDADWRISIHLMPRLSDIPWHNDSDHAVNITVYLSPLWRADDQGYFIYDDGECLKAIIPQPNLGLIYETPMMHTVSLVNTMAPVRESLQIFINRPSDAGNDNH